MLISKYVYNSCSFCINSQFNVNIVLKSVKYEVL